MCASDSELSWVTKSYFSRLFLHNMPPQNLVACHNCHNCFRGLRVLWSDLVQLGGSSAGLRRGCRITAGHGITWGLSEALQWPDLLPLLFKVV